MCGGLCEARCVDERSADLWMKFRIEWCVEEASRKGNEREGPRSAQLSRDALPMQTRHPALMRVP